MASGQLTQTRWRTGRAWLSAAVILSNVALVGSAIWVRTGTKPTLVRVAAGSEDVRFFQDQAVVDEFARKGYDVQATGFGSIEMATAVNPSSYDLLFPSSGVIADQLEAKAGGGLPRMDAFSSPLVVLTWQPLLAPLESAGLISQEGGTLQFHLDTYLQKVQSGLRWTDLPGNSAFTQPLRVLLNMSDPQSSNSAAMFVAAASYELNGQNVVSGSEAVNTVSGQLKQAIKLQGDLAHTSDPVVDNYLTYFMDGAPLILTYESEFVDRVIPAELARSLPAHQTPVLAYLEPSVASEHTLMPRDAAGSAVADLIQHDPTILEAEGTHGFRVPGQSLATDLTSYGVQVVPNFGVIPAPTEFYLKELIDASDPNTGQ